MTVGRDPARRLLPAAPRGRAPVAAVGLLMLVLAGACATVTDSPSASAAPSGSAGASGGAPVPSPTWWPGGIVESVIGLGKGDGEILKAGADLGAAAAYEDLPAMRGAADGLADLLGRLRTLVDRMREYPATAEVATSYDTSLPVMLEGASKIRDAIDAGDAAGLAAASQELSKGLNAYAETRRLLGPLVDRAILMQRLLTN
jgi:hypothetical protein